MQQGGIYFAGQQKIDRCFYFSCTVHARGDYEMLKMPWKLVLVRKSGREPLNG